MQEHESEGLREKLIAEKMVEIKAEREAKQALHSDPLIAHVMFTVAKMRDLHEATRAVGNEQPKTPTPATPIKKKDLIDKYQQRWPSIAIDFKDGNNGLQNTRMKHGVYDENKVIQWGKDNARLKPEPVNPASLWGSKNSKKHTIGK